MVSQELHYSALTLQFPRWPPNSPKISQAGDLGVVADSIHVNLKHTHFSLVSLAPADALLQERLPISIPHGFMMGHSSL